MTIFILDVQRVEQTCLFRLTWNQSQSCSARIIYPETLTTFYQEWSTSYLAYYHSRSRARLGIKMGLLEVTLDWRSRLVNAEADLLKEFQDWLHGKELYQIRCLLAQASFEQTVQLYIQCNELSLAKLPWESWQIEAEFNRQSSIQILRTAPEIISASVSTVKRVCPRILAILGDDTGLDFQAEREAIQKQLKGIASVQFEGWGISSATDDLQTRLCQVIEHPQGWDVLFFAGHSNETGSGELMIAPDTAVFVHELEKSIKIAKTNGLQVAIFNSCKGLKIANALISWGINHVVVMREPIRNDVAQKFFEKFVQSLAAYQNVYSATCSACNFLFLNAQKNFQYPSAFLVPSIYAYPGTVPYQFPLPRHQRFNIFKQLKPTWKEVIILSAIAFLSCQVNLQHSLIDVRQLIQANFPQPGFGIPPVLLVKIDDASLNEAKIEQKDPLDRSYLAKVIRHTATLKTPIVGIDYVLKDYQPNQTELVEAIRASSSTQFVFAASSIWGKPLAELLPTAYRLGDIDLTKVENFPVFLARTRGDLSEIPDVIPFPHQIACLQDAQCDRGRARMQGITWLSAFWGQTWLNPWINYSIAPNHVYSAVSAKQFLTMPSSQQQIVLIAPGSEFDAYSSPQAFANQTQPNWKMAGGEIHAYMIQNLLQRCLIIPIPDIWMVGLVGIVSKLILHNFKQPKRNSIKRYALIIAPVSYAAISLGIYHYAAVSLPILFPILVYFLYLGSSRLKRTHQA